MFRRLIRPKQYCSDHSVNLGSLYNREVIESTLKVSRRSRALRECLVGGHEDFGTMTTKEKAISVIRSLDDNASLDEMIDRLYLLRKIESGIAQADARDVMEHEEFMAELEQEDG